MRVRVAVAGGLCILLAVAVSAAGTAAAAPAPSAEVRLTQAARADVEANRVVRGTCRACHNDRSLRGNLSLERFDVRGRGRARRRRRADGAQAAGGHDAAARSAPPGRRGAAQSGRDAGAPPRRGRGARPGSGQPPLPAPQPRGVRAGHPRPAGPRCRRRRLAAAGSGERQLRQHRRRPDPVGHAAGGVPERGERHQPARGRRAQRPGRRSHLHELRVRVAASLGPRRGGALRHPRRPGGRPRVPGRRGVHLRVDVHLRRQHAHRGRRRLHRRRAGGPAALQHRPAGRCGRPGRGEHRDAAGLRPGRDASRGGGVHPAARRALRGPHPPARLVLRRWRLGRGGRHDSAARPRRHHQRALQRDRPVGDAEPAARLHVPSHGSRRGSPLRPPDLHAAGPRGVPPVPDRPGSGRPAGVLRPGDRERRFRGGRPDGGWRRCWRARTSCCGSSASRSTRRNAATA